ncbi:MAG: hypothetical protein H6697_09995 [Myxococcales bacterium]|nr:hypothetical protein [Myxococcales bacterium]
MSNEHDRRLIADGIVEVAAGPQKVTVALDDAAKAAIGIEMGDTFRDLDVVKDEYLTARRDFGTRIKAKEEHIRELTEQLRNGEAKREVPCTARAHLDRGELVVTRDDTGEEVSRRTLTAREVADYNQLRLDLDAAPTADAAVAIRTAFAARVVADAAPGAGPPQPGVHLSSKQEEPKRMQEVEFTADDLADVEEAGSFESDKGVFARWKTRNGRNIFVAQPSAEASREDLAHDEEALAAYDELHGEEVETDGLNDDDGPSYSYGDAAEARA